ncbi:MAG: DNA primase [Acidobacteria bacterium]|nr:DNA primase [Acidobacteriota bacterium]
MGHTMKFGDSFVEQLKTSIDIVHVVQAYVRLRKSGSSFIGICPFHQEKTPSFHVRQSPAYYYCFGCGAKGDAISFVQNLERISFPETVKLLAERYGIPLPKIESTPEADQTVRERQALLEIHEKAAEIFKSQLTSSSEGKQALSYLKERGLSDQTIEKFGLGYAPGFSDNLVRRLNGHFSSELLIKSGLIQTGDSGRPYDRFRRRVMFPICKESGKIVAFGGRIFGEGQPKYLNSPETPIYSKSRTLYALDVARDSMRRKGFAILVEGYMDCIALHQAGIDNTIASCGTSLTELQAKLLARFSDRIVVNFDPDTAGSAATLRSLDLFLEQNFKIRVLALPGGDDPDAFIKRHGVAAYSTLLDKAPAYFDYLLQKSRQENDLRSVEGKIQAVNQVLPYLAKIPNRMERVEQTKRVAEFFGFEESIIREELKKTAKPKQEKPEINRSQIRSKLTPSEKYLLKAILDNPKTAQEVIEQLSVSGDYLGLDSEGIFRQAIAIFTQEGRIDPGRLLERLDNNRDKDFVNQALFSELSFEVRDCLAELKKMRSKLVGSQLQNRIRKEAEQDAALSAELFEKRKALKLQSGV